MTKRQITLPDGSGKVEVEAEDELPMADRASNADALRDRTSAALEANRKFLANANPTPPQTAAQVRLLTQECSAVIRLLLGRLEGTD